MTTAGPADQASVTVNAQDVLIARSARRRSAAATGWRSRLIDAYAKGSSLRALGASER